MSFMLEYLRTKIAANMESSDEREKRWEERLRGAHKAAKNAKANMELPTKPWGFWRSEKNSAKFETNSDPTISKMPGRAKLDWSR